MATGTLTRKGYVGKAADGKDLKTILDIAREQFGKVTGIVTTDTLYGATPVAFSAHAITRNDTEQLIRSQLESNVTLLCGAYDDACVEIQSLIDAAGYTYCDDYGEISQTMQADKVYWQFGLAGISASTELKDVTVNALEYLDRDEDGFVLVVEQAYIDKYSHANNFARMEKSVNSLNDTVDAVLAWIGDRTDVAVLVTADHETGGLSVSPEPNLPNLFETFDNTTIYIDWYSKEHTNANVGLFYYGFDSDFAEYTYYASAHLIKNTDIFTILLNLMSK